MKSFTVVAALVLALVSGSTAQGMWCAKDRSVCAKAVVDAAKKNVTITVTSSFTGWVGLGIGSAMADADVVAGWPNAAKNYVVSDRTAKGHAQPTVDTLQDINWTRNQSTSSITPLDPSHTGVRFTYSRQLTGGSPGSKAITPGTPQSFIWAASNQVVNNGTLLQHESSNKGTFQWDVLQTAGSASGTNGSTSSTGTASGGSGSGAISAFAASSAQAVGLSLLSVIVFAMFA
ncbi:hypothetical protein BJ742DRAFT_868556 [Cladochytrium replicatum]|nr:hypothetical protein BJ742DRAFT_868556 [Cladochytrium replicatum]